MKILITGAAGFIGAALAKKLLTEDHIILGVDNHNDYYSQDLKESRIQNFYKHSQYTHRRLDIADRKNLESVFADFKPEIVVNLAAQAGVRYSIENPFAYVDANISGFMTILEGCRHHQIKHLVYASSSSVYGGNRNLPFSVNDSVDHPMSMYAATKKANESMAHAHAHLWDLPTTMFRFFTVYGPWGRPDLALYKFVDAILDDRPIDIYNDGDMYRDFTYVGDLVRGIRMLVDAAPQRPDNADIIPDYDSLSPVAPYRVVNIGNSDKVKLLDFIDAIEECLGKQAIRNYMPMQKGDVPGTWADNGLLRELTGFRPDTNFKDGIRQFVEWYRIYVGK